VAFTAEVVKACEVKQFDFVDLGTCLDFFVCPFGPSGGSIDEITATAVKPVEVGC
jgi:hypothetical protein